MPEAGATAVPADARAAFDAMQALEDALTQPRPDGRAALAAVQALEEAILGKRAAR